MSGEGLADLFDVLVKDLGLRRAELSADATEAVDAVIASFVIVADALRRAAHGKGEA